MKLRANLTSAQSAHRRQQNGFSLVELLLSLAVMLVITTMAVPIIVKSLQTYQLNASATQLSGMLKFTKFEAIRQNTPVSCQIVQQGSNWQVWVDSNGNGVADGAEPQMFVGGVFTLLDGSTVPNTQPIKDTLGGGKTLPWVVVSGNNGSITYDQRGVSVTLDANSRWATATSVYVLYLGGAANTDIGYRAIVWLPSGAVQVWTSSSAGDWQRIS